MNVSIHLPDRMIVVHTDPDLNRTLSLDDSSEALDVIELTRHVLAEHVARLGGELPAGGNGVRWRISDSTLGG